MSSTSSTSRSHHDANDSAPGLRLNDLPSLGRIGPRADDVDAPYWEGLRSGELRRCGRCRTRWWFGVYCHAADRAVQVFGGFGYSRHTPFEHIYRHRITEGTEEIQIHPAGGYPFDFMKQQMPKGTMTGDWNAYPCWI